MTIKVTLLLYIHDGKVVYSDDDGYYSVRVVGSRSTYQSLFHLDATDAHCLAKIEFSCLLTLLE